VVVDGWEWRGSTSHRLSTWATLDACWRVGSLEHLLDETQLEIHNFVRDCPSRTVYVSASRQLGKSFGNIVAACETAIRNPGGRINYIAKTFGALSKMMESSMRLIAEQAPPELRPVFVTGKSRWVFPEEGPAAGAFVQLVGADDVGGADTARGGAVVLNIVDEAAFIDCLDYLLNSVVKPMGMRAAAQTVLTTSPALSPDHYSCDVEDTCAAQGALIVRDYWSPGMLTREEKVAFLEGEAAALNLTLEQFTATSTYRREYGCQRVLDTTLAVVPEFPEHRATIVEAGRVAVRPPYCDLYFAGDPGTDDFFGGLFAVVDWRRSKLVIEHELLLEKANTATFVREWQAVMAAHYPCAQDDVRSMRIVTADNAYNVVRPYAAILDTTVSKAICADIHSYHGLSFSPAVTADRETSINELRLVVASGRLEIHPRCEKLITQLGVATRKKPGGDMVRSKRHGHFDLVSSCRYLVRSIDWTHNPFPADYGFNALDQTRRERPPPQTLGSVLLRGSHIGRRRN